MITGHHRTDDRSPSELAWQAIKGHEAIVKAIESHYEAHQLIRDKRLQDMAVAMAEHAAASE